MLRLYFSLSPEFASALVLSLALALALARQSLSIWASGMSIWAWKHISFPSHHLLHIVPWSSILIRIAVLRGTYRSQSSVQYYDRIVPPMPARSSEFTLATHASTPLRPQNQHPGHSLRCPLESLARSVATWPCRAPAGTLGNKSSTLFHVLLQLFVDGGPARTKAVSKLGIQGRDIMQELGSFPDCCS